MDLPEHVAVCDVCFACVPRALMYFHREWHDTLTGTARRARDLDVLDILPTVSVPGPADRPAARPVNR